MKRGSRAAAVAAALALVPVAAAGFTLLRVGGNPCGNAQNLYWADHRAAISVDPLTNPTQLNLVLQAADSWNAAVLRFHFQSQGGSRCNGADGVVGVGKAATTCDGRTLEGVIALTTSTFQIDNGQMVDGTVTFNSNAPVLDDNAVFLQAAVHELGHVLGLDHSDACGASGAGTVMKTTIVLSDPRISAPQTDDVNGAKAIYGGNGDPTPIPAGANSCAVNGGEARTFVPLSIALAGALLLSRRAALRRGL